jgi:large subunit ribosomal protein L23
MHVYDVLVRPVISEKNTMLSALNKYSFQVAEGATKPMVKSAVQEAFKVDVTDVNMIRVPSKTRRVGRRQVPTKPWTKAVVTVREGQRIEIFEAS